MAVRVTVFVVRAIEFASAFASAFASGFPTTGCVVERITAVIITRDATIPAIKMKGVQLCRDAVGVSMWSGLVLK